MYVKKNVGYVSEERTESTKLGKADITHTVSIYLMYNLSIFKLMCSFFVLWTEYSYLYLYFPQSKPSVLILHLSTHNVFDSKRTDTYVIYLYVGYNNPVYYPVQTLNCKHRALCKYHVGSQQQTITGSGAVLGPWCVPEPLGALTAAVPRLSASITAWFCENNSISISSLSVLAPAAPRAPPPQHQHHHHNHPSLAGWVCIVDAATVSLNLPRSPLRSPRGP